MIDKVPPVITPPSIGGGSGNQGDEQDKKKTSLKKKLKEKMKNLLDEGQEYAFKVTISVAKKE